VSVRVVPVSLPHLHSVALVCALRGGPRFEGPDETGLTHFMEHMLFRGAGAHREPAALMAAFEDVGEDPEAHTGDDELVVSVLVSPEKVERAARLLAAVLLRPAWRHLERERRIVLEERAGLVDEEGAPLDLDDISRPLVFGDHPLGRSLVGDAEDIKRYRRADLEGHRRRLVVDRNLVVALAGPVGPGHVRAVRRAFAEVPTGEAPLDTPIALPTSPRWAFAKVPGSPQCDLRLTFRGPGAENRQLPALQLLSQVLDGGPTARLPLRLVDAGFIYEAQAGLVMFPGVSLLEIDLSVSASGLVDALERVLAIVSGVRRDVTARELARARARIVRRRLLERDDARETAERHARRALFGLAEPKLGAADRRAVLDAAREVLRPDRFSCILSGSPGRRVRQEVASVLGRWVGAPMPRAFTPRRLVRL
jgi:predicted Zn-dependent peptidase